MNYRARPKTTAGRVAWDAFMKKMGTIPFAYGGLTYTSHLLEKGNAYCYHQHTAVLPSIFMVRAACLDFAYRRLLGFCLLAYWG